MRGYGAHRPRDERESYQRADPERRNQRSMRRNQGRPLHPPNYESEIRKKLRRYARQQARAEIRYELHLWWLERELNTSPTRKLFKVNDYAYLKEIASESEIYELEQQIWYQHEMDSLLYDEDNRYSDSHGHVRYYDPELDDSDSSEPDVQDPAWRDAWIDGEVNTQYDAIWDHDYPIDYDCLYPDDFDPEEYYRDLWAKEFPAPNLHLDSDRNQERLRAGQRFYRQNNRTTSK